MISEENKPSTTDRRLSNPQTPLCCKIPIPSYSNHGKGRVFQYGLVSSKNYYYEKRKHSHNGNQSARQQQPQQSSFNNSNRISVSEDKSQELNPSKVSVSSICRCRPSKAQCNNLRGGIVKLLRRMKKYKETDIKLIVLIQLWWKEIFMKRSWIANVRNEYDSFGGIVPLSEEYLQTEINRRSNLLITSRLTTKVNEYEAEKTEDSDKDKEKRDSEVNGMMIKRLLPWSVQKINKSNYGEYCKRYVSEQALHNTQSGKNRLRGVKKDNRIKIKMEMRDIWVEECKVSDNAHCEIVQERNDKKDRQGMLKVITPIAFTIEGNSKHVENQGMNTIEWNSQITKDNEAIFTLDRMYKIKNWNKTNSNDKFSFELQNPFETTNIPEVLIYNMKRRLIQIQSKYYVNDKQSNDDIIYKGIFKAAWNKTNFSERFNINLLKTKKDTPKQELQSSQPIALEYNPLNEDNDYLSNLMLILTKKQMAKREALMKISNDQCSIKYNPYYLKWNSVNINQTPANQSFTIKPLYKKSDWNKKNQQFASVVNLSHLPPAKASNQYVPNTQFHYDKCPKMRFRRWNENNNKTKSDAFEVKSEYDRINWNRTNLVDNAERFKEKGIEHPKMNFDDFSFSIIAKKNNDYEILLTDREKDDIYKMTRGDIMYLWNKLNKIEEIKDVKSIHDDDYEVLEIVNQPIQKVRAVRKKEEKRKAYEDYEITSNNDILLESYNRRFPLDQLEPSKSNDNISINLPDYDQLTYYKSKWNKKNHERQQIRLEMSKKKEWKKEIPSQIKQCIPTQFEYLQDETENEKKRDIKRRKRLADQMEIENLSNNDNEYLAPPKAYKNPRFNTDKFSYEHNHQNQINAIPKESVLSLWKRRNKIDNDRDKITIICNSQHEKLPKANEWNDTITKQCNEPFTIDQLPIGSKWNKANKMDNSNTETNDSILGNEQLVWNDLNKNITSTQFKILQRSHKEKWNKNNCIDTPKDSIDINGIPLYLQWNNKATIEGFNQQIPEQQEEKQKKPVILKQGIDVVKPRISAGINRPIQVQWTGFSLYPMSKAPLIPKNAAIFTIEQSYPKHNRIQWNEANDKETSLKGMLRGVPQYEKWNEKNCICSNDLHRNSLTYIKKNFDNDSIEQCTDAQVEVLTISKEANETILMPIGNTSFYILPQKYYHKKRWNNINQIEEIDRDINEGILACPKEQPKKEVKEIIRRQWSQLALDKQNESVDFKGLKPSELEAIRKDWNDINKVENLSINHIKSTKIIPIIKQAEPIQDNNEQVEEILPSKNTQIDIKLRKKKKQDSINDESDILENMGNKKGYIKMNKIMSEIKKIQPSPRKVSEIPEKAENPNETSFHKSNPQKVRSRQKQSQLDNRLQERISEPSKTEANDEKASINDYARNTVSNINDYKKSQDIYEQKHKSIRNKLFNKKRSPEKVEILRELNFNSTLMNMSSSYPKDDYN